MLIDLLWLYMESTIIIVIILALILDIIWGEPPVKVHPVVWMGKIIQSSKPFLLKINSKCSGFLLTMELLLIFLIPLLLILYLVKFSLIIYILVSSLILFTTFSIKFLLKTVNDIKFDLEEDLNKTRKSVSYLVSRDTSNLSEAQLVSATVESLTENITDSVVSPLFFAFLLGLPGAMAFRIINTLDAMVGYKNEENRVIGWFPAKFDDVLNYIPARITGFIIVLAALLVGMDWKNSYRIMLRDARSTPSPNSGFSMAAAAGALGIQLEKPGVYVIGDDTNNLDIKTISNALKLTKITVFLFVILFTVLFSLIFILISYYFNIKFNFMLW